VECVLTRFLLCVSSATQIPMVQGVTSGLHSRTISVIYKGLAAVQKSAPLSACE
jgi:hypothetical protein